MNDVSASSGNSSLGTSLLDTTQFEINYEILLPPNKYKCVENRFLDYRIYHLVVHDERLICTLMKGLKILNAETLEILETVKFQNINKADCAIPNDNGGYLVISLDRGISEINNCGVERYQLVEGKFFGLSIVEGNKCFSYDSNANQLVCFKRGRVNYEWDEVKTVELEYGPDTMVTQVGLWEKKILK